MPRRARRQFSQEFKDEAVRWVYAGGKTLPQVACDLDLAESALRSWMQGARSDTAPDQSSAATSVNSCSSCARKTA